MIRFKVKLVNILKIKNDIQVKIDELNVKLDLGKNNLFGFLNKNKVPNKTKFLALCSDEGFI